MNLFKTCSIVWLLVFLDLPGKTVAFTRFQQSAWLVLDDLYYQNKIRVVKKQDHSFAGVSGTLLDPFRVNKWVAQSPHGRHSAPVCVFLPPHHMLYRHGLWGHRRRAPLCGRHGLILPVLASGQLLLSGLAPVHLWPEDGRTDDRKQQTPSGSFYLFQVNISKNMCCKKENCSNVFSFLLVDSSPFTIFYFVFMIPVRRIMNFKDQLYCKCGRNMNVNLALTLYGGTMSQTPSGKSNWILHNK